MNEKKLFFKDVIYSLLTLGVFFLGILYGTTNNPSLGNIGDTYLISYNLFFTIAIPFVIYLMFTISLILSIKDKSLLINKKFIISSVIIFITMIYLALLTIFKDNSHLINPQNKPYLVEAPYDRLKSFFDVTIMFINIFLLFNLVKAGKKIKYISFYIFTFGVVLFALIAIIYSLINEQEIYKAIFSDFSIVFDDTIRVVHRVKSFFYFNNVFSHYCSLALLTVMALSFVLKKKWIMLLSLFFFFFVVVGGSRTAFLAGLVLYFLYIIYFVLSLKKKNKIAFIVLLSILIIFVTYILLDIFLLKNIHLNNSRGESFTLYESFELFFDVLKTNRFPIVTNTLKLYHPLDFIIGQGYEIDMFSVRSYGNYNYHNSFMEVFMAGGIPLTLFYLYLFYKIIKLVIARFKEGNKDLLYLLIILVIYSAQYSLSESITIFFNYNVGAVLTYLFVAPFILCEKEKTIN